MHNRGLLDHVGRTKSVTLEELKRDLDSIRNNMRTIEEFEVSEEAKRPILRELEEKINEIKEQMHNCIDVL